MADMKVRLADIGSVYVNEDTPSNVITWLNSIGKKTDIKVTYGGNAGSVVAFVTTRLSV